MCTSPALFHVLYIGLVFFSPLCKFLSLIQKLLVKSVFAIWTEAPNSLLCPKFAGGYELVWGFTPVPYGVNSSRRHHHPGCVPRFASWEIHWWPWIFAWAAAFCGRLSRLVFSEHTIRRKATFCISSNYLSLCSNFWKANESMFKGSNCKYYSLVTCFPLSLVKCDF